MTCPYNGIHLAHDRPKNSSSVSTAGSPDLGHGAGYDTCTNRRGGGTRLMPILRSSCATSVMSSPSISSCTTEPRRERSRDITEPRCIEATARALMTSPLGYDHEGFTAGSSLNTTTEPLTSKRTRYSTKIRISEISFPLVRNRLSARP